MNSAIIVSVVIILFIFLISILLLIEGFSLKGNYEQCRDFESPSCFNVTCQNPTTTCGGYAYKCKDNGKVMCSYNQYIDNDDLDNLCSSST